MHADTRLRCIFHLPSFATSTNTSNPGLREPLPCPQQCAQLPLLPGKALPALPGPPRRTSTGAGEAAHPAGDLIGSVSSAKNKPPSPPWAPDAASDPRLPPPARPHLPPGLLPPGCAALQVAGLGGGGLPGQAGALGLLHGLLAAGPIGPDAVDGAGLGATSAGGRAGCPGPCLPAGREQKPVRLARQPGRSPGPRGCPLPPTGVDWRPPHPRPIL